MNRLAHTATTMVMTYVLLLGASLAQAAILDFDDIDLDDIDPEDSTRGLPSELNYGGFNWDSKWSVGSTDTREFGHTAQSGKQVLFNEGATRRLSISRDSAFDFLGAWFSAPTKLPAGFIRIRAYDADNVSLGSTGYLNDAYVSGPILIDAAFYGVSRLEIDPFGGTFTMDSFSYQDPIVTLTEAGSLVLLGIGILGLWAARRRLL